MPAPVISVVMAARDGARHLDASLRTVLDQTGPALEAIVVNDGSVDETAAMLDAHAHRDARLRVIHQSTQGFTAALITATREARGRYLARHDLDDRSLPGRFAAQVAFLEAHPHLAAVGAATDVINEHDAIVSRFVSAQGTDAVQKALLDLTATPVHGSMMIRRDAFDEVGGYRAAFTTSQDYDLWLRLVERFPIDVMAPVLYQWRLNPHGVYATRRTMQLQYAGIARTFARERARYGQDSYADLVRSGGDLAQFSEQYRLAGPLEALWGELLFRALNAPQIARAHLWRAVRRGSMTPRMLALFGWALLGQSWPGGKPLPVRGE